jgi:hypothetical protein
MLSVEKENHAVHAGTLYKPLLLQRLGKLLAKTIFLSRRALTV